MDILDYTGTKFINSPIDLPTIGGNSGEKGKTGVIVQLWIGGKLFEVPVDPKTGLFTWTATEPFPDGDYSVSIRTLDRAGNLGKPTLRTMRIDTTPPDAPELLFLTDDEGPKTGLLEAGQTTDDKRPKLTGIAQEGTLVYLRDADGNTIGSARADEVTGKWVMEPNQELEEGVNNLVLVAEETFGGVTREGAPSASFKIIIGADSGILPPDTITITQAIDDAGSATGVLSNGALTDDTTPTLNGVVSAGSTVTVYYRLAGSNIWAGSATATVTGENWTWTPGSALPTGTYEFQASIGSTSSALFVLDIAAGADDIQKKTRIESAQDDFGTWQGPLSNGAITDDTTPTLSGRGEANGKVVVRYGQPGQSNSTVVVDVDSSGHWKWTPASNLPAGNWTFEVQPQGHSKWSDSFSLSITDTGGYNPIITEGLDDVGTSSVLHSNDTTDDTTPTLFGRAEANSLVYLRASNGSNSTVYSMNVDSTGNWEWTPPASLALGQWNFQASKTTTGGWSDAFNLTLSLPVPKSYAFDYEANSLKYWADPITGITYKVVDTLTGLTMQKITGLMQWGQPPNNNYQFAVGNRTTLIGDKATAEFDFGGAERVSFQTIGGDNGYMTITVYSATNSVISQETKYITPNQYDVENYSYQGNGQLIGKIVITVNDYMGVYIDNFKWTKPAQVFGLNDINDSPLAEESSAHIDSYIINNENKVNDTLEISLNDILMHGKEDFFIADGSKQMLIGGNEGDVVKLVDILPEGSDISEWQQQSGTVTVAGLEYQVYSHGESADLLVQQGVKTELI